MLTSLIRIDHAGANITLRIPWEVKDATSSWNIGRIVTCRRARRGEVNHNFIIRTTQGKYVLRQVSHTHHKTPSDMNFELDYLDYLRRAGFPYQIPSAIPTKNGELFIYVRDHYHWLYRFIEGAAAQRFSGKRLAQLARMMATYHLMIEKSHLTNRKPSSDLFNRSPVLREIGNFQAEILRKNRANRSDAAFVKESKILERILRGLDGRQYSNLKRYPIHGDINPENLVWKNGSLVGLLDFENVGTTNGPTVRDISQLYNTAFRQHKIKSQLDLDLAKRSLLYYKQYHPMSDIEVRLIPDLMTASFIEDFVWAFWMLRNDPERARGYRLALYSRGAQWSDSNRERIAQALLN